MDAQVAEEVQVQVGLLMVDRDMAVDVVLHMDTVVGGMDMDIDMDIIILLQWVGVDTVDLHRGMEDLPHLHIIGMIRGGKDHALVIETVHLLVPVNKGGEVQVLEDGKEIVDMGEEGKLRILVSLPSVINVL